MCTKSFPKKVKNCRKFRVPERKYLEVYKNQYFQEAVWGVINNGWTDCKSLIKFEYCAHCNGGESDCGVDPALYAGAEWIEHA